jgi:hypothetical protein
MRIDHGDMETCAHREASIRVVKDHLHVCLRDGMASALVEQLLPLLLPHVGHVVEDETDGMEKV